MIDLWGGQRTDERSNRRLAGDPRPHGAEDARDDGSAPWIRDRASDRTDERRRAETERGDRLRVADATAATRLDFSKLGRLGEQSEGQVLRHQQVRSPS